LPVECRIIEAGTSKNSSGDGKAGLLQEEKYLLSFIPFQALHVDQIIQKSGFSSSKVGNLLLHLELKGQVKQLPGKYFLKS